MIPTSSALILLLRFYVIGLLHDRPERISHHAPRLAAGSGDERQFHRQADAQTVGIRFGQVGLDPHLSGKFDVPDSVWLERVAIIDRVRRRLRREALNRPPPERPAPGPRPPPPLNPPAFPAA